jgi:type IV pilus assembly protein PilM
MGLSGELILRFTENNINLSQVKKSGKKVKILASKDFEIVENSDEDGNITYSDKEGEALASYLKERKFSGKAVKVIIAQDGIITRQIQCPKLSRRDLDKFISNNIGEYFTLNIDDYEYDYTIVAEEKGEVEKFSLLIVLLPKSKLTAIKEFIKGYNLDIDKITIYPVCIENTFYWEREKSIAVFDIGEDRTNITILEKGSIFLYSRTNSYIDVENNDFDEVLDSLLYFLNFYSTRHFGNRVDKIYITGKLWNNKEFRRILQEQTPVEIISGIKIPNTRIETKEGIDKNLYADIMGALFAIRKKYKKDINFSALSKVEKRTTNQLPIILTASFLLVVTMSWLLTFYFYKTAKKEKYDSYLLDQEINKLIESSARYDELKEIEEKLDNKEEIEKFLQSINIDFSPYIEALRQGLPADTYVKTFRIDPLTIGASFIVDGTLDKVALVESINDIGIFEKVNIDTIKLDDTEKEVQLELTIKKPLEEE